MNNSFEFSHWVRNVVISFIIFFIIVIFIGIALLIGVGIWGASEISEKGVKGCVEQVWYGSTNTTGVQ